MTDPTAGLLFEIAPIVDEDSKKKKPSRRKKETAAESFSGGGWCDQGGCSVGFLLSLDDVLCDQCGLPCDLVEVVRDRDNDDVWRVTCGWWCHHSWIIEPISGLLDKADSETEVKSKEFVMREGKHSGKTFDEIAAEPDGVLYIENLTILTKRKSVAAAASEWLSRKNR